MFRDLPGHDRVMREKYNLVHQDTGALVQSTKWSHIVSPGSIILMNIVIRITASPWELDHRPPKVVCPRCNEELPQSNASLRWSVVLCARYPVQWHADVYLRESSRRCYRDFGFSESERVVELAPQPVRPPAGIQNTISADGKTASKTNMTTFRREADRATELFQFQRVHFMRERLLPSWDSLIHEFDRSIREVMPNGVHLTVASGSLSELERVLEERLDLEVRDIDDLGFDPSIGWTPLQLAASHGEYNMVDILIRAGANVNASAPDGGYTAIQAAARSGNLATVERLLQAGAHIKSSTPNERSSAIQAAALSGNLAIIERLLQAGADINAPTPSTNYTALRAAANFGNLAIVERLLQAGADVDGPAPGKVNTALQIGAASGALAIVERLLQAGADVNASGSYTALQAGAALGGLAVVERLLQAGANVNAAASEKGLTAIQAAVASENIVIVERLLQAGAEVNAPASERGHTAIQVAARCGNLAIVEQLLQAGADVNAPAAPKQGHTAIQAAAIFENLATVERLLQAGADFNAPATSWGTTAIQGAVRSGNLAILERLLEAGADVNAPGANCDGYTTMSMSYTAIQAAAHSGNVTIIERLLQAGADANDRGSCNKSSLEIAEMRGNIETVNLLSGLVPNRPQVPTRTIPTPAMAMSRSWFLRSDIYSAVAPFI